ncbi:MAG: ribonuclease H-like domain-containing protein [Planctomycetota bacterium]|jgi:uncharacterized protein YprB with RNaseH-like and TPR domain
MLERTFIHIEGVGEATERAIWDAGVATWDDFAANAEGVPGLGPAKRAAVTRGLDESRAALARGDAPWFGSALKTRDSWRLAADFRDRLAFVDIETTGMGFGSVVTVVGVYAGGDARAFVRGIDLDDLPAALQPYDVYVTYNGRCFDVPFLVNEFGRRIAPAAHIDLRFVLAAVGLKGGLKGVERAVGIARPGDLAALDGWDAVRLWGEYLDGNAESLRTLVRYNIEDILNLEPLLDIAIARHTDERCLPFDRPEAASVRDAARARTGTRALERLGRSTGLW